MKKTFTQKFWANQSRKGFTLVELVMAIAILAVIAAIAIPIVSSVIRNANENTDINNGKTVDLMIKEAYTEINAGISTLKPADTTNGATVAEVLKSQGLESLLSADSKSFVYKSKDVKFYYNNGTIKAINTRTESADGWTELTPEKYIDTVCEHKD